MGAQLAIQFLQDATDTRNESYKKLCAEGRELSQAQKLLKLYCALGDLTDREAARLLNIPEARVSARRNELMEEKNPLIISKGKFFDAVTKREVHKFGIHQ